MFFVVQLQKHVAVHGLGVLAILAREPPQPGTHACFMHLLEDAGPRTMSASRCPGAIEGAEHDPVFADRPRCGGCSLPLGAKYPLQWCLKGPVLSSRARQLLAGLHVSSITCCDAVAKSVPLLMSKAIFHPASSMP